MVEDVKYDVVEGPLVVFFIKVPEFGNVVIRDDINKLIAKDGLHVICFFGIFVLGFELSLKGSTGFSGDGRIWCRTGWGDEVMAVACKV